MIGALTNCWLSNLKNLEGKLTKEPKISWFFKLRALGEKRLIKAGRNSWLSKSKMCWQRLIGAS